MLWRVNVLTTTLGGNIRGIPYGRPCFLTDVTLKTHFKGILCEGLKYKSGHRRSRTAGHQAGKRGAAKAGRA